MRTSRNNGRAKLRASRTHAVRTKSTADRGTSVGRELALEALLSYFPSVSRVEQGVVHRHGEAAAPAFRQAFKKLEREIRAELVALRVGDVAS